MRRRFHTLPLHTHRDEPTTRPNCPLSPPTTLGLAARLTARPGSAGRMPSAAAVAIGGGGGGPDVARRAACKHTRSGQVEETGEGWRVGCVG